MGLGFDGRSLTPARQLPPTPPSSPPGPIGRQRQGEAMAARDERQMPMFDWVAERRDRITFGLQAAPRPDDPEPGQRILAAGQLADDLGLDAFYVSDHPADGPECWVHLAAL